MLRRAVPRSGLLLGLSALGVALLSPAVSRAQSEPKGSPETMTQRWPGPHKVRFLTLIKGEDRPGAKDDDKVLDTAAEYFVSRTTWRSSLKNPETFPALMKANARELAVAIKDNALPNAPKNLAFLKQWTKRMVAAFEEVFGLTIPENRLAVVNASLLLPVFAKARQEEFGEFLEKLIADAKLNDVTKLYALEGLREYLPARPLKASDDPEDKAIHQQLARDTRRIGAILKFLDRKWETMDPTVAAYIRRAALRTLAEAEVPALVVQKGGEVVAPAAYALVLALAPEKDDPNVKPSFRASKLSVKAEAAIGVCRLRARAVPAYQPEAGVYLVGRFLVDFIREYRTDYGSFSVNKQKKKDQPKVVPLLPWKLEAERLIKHLDELPGNLNDKRPFYPKAVAMAKAARDVLVAILVSIREYRSIEEPAALQLRVNELAAFATKNETLYKGVEKFKAKLSADE